MSDDTLVRRLAAVLSADAVSYSRLMAADEVATYRLLRARLDVLARAVTRHHGRVVDCVGDNLLAEFASAVQAVSCAVEAQHDLEAENAALQPEQRLQFRIGINVGDVLVEDGRVAGDGVNIAARLEELAPPGGICLSHTAFDQVEEKLDLEFEDHGEHTVRNIPRPIRAYVVRLDCDAASPTTTGLSPAAGSTSISGFGGRPAIAVLPFRDSGGDEDGRWFADAITDELTTRLSLFRWFPVIAASSARKYGGEGVDPARVRRELGVRYLIEGSVRRAGRRVRIIARLCDASSSHQLWADHYDRELADLFVLQDAIADAILGSLMPAIDRTERSRVLHHPPQSLDAWDCVQRGSWHIAQMTREHMRLAQEWLRRAAELDPHTSAAHSMMAVTCAHEIAFQWTDDPAATLRLCVESSARAVALSEDDPVAHLACGWSDSFRREWGRAVSSFERAVEMNPSFAAAHHGLGFALSMLERPRDAIARIETAVRLSPLDPFMHVFQGHLGQSYFQEGRFEDAVRHVTHSLRLRPGAGFSYLLAASYGFLDRPQEARAVLDECARHDPAFSFETLRLFLPPSLVERQREGLIRAGVAAVAS